MRLSSLLAGVLLVAGAAAADTSGSVALRAHALAGDLMSPYCPGRTLSDCPSPDAAVLRQEIRARLEAGESEEQVRASLEERFGGALRGLPSSAIGWLGPIAILLGGAGALALALRRLSRGGASRPTPKPPAALERELDAELRRRGL